MIYQLNKIPAPKKRQKQEFVFRINNATTNHLLKLGTEKLGISERYPNFDMGTLRKIAITSPLAHGFTKKWGKVEYLLVDKLNFCKLP